MSRHFSWILAVATCVTGFQPAAVHGQDKQNDAAKILGQTLETGSMPFWSKPTADAKQDLGKAARTAEQGVFLVGFPKVGTGTAWVISKKHRLLVTNAHVADMYHGNGGKMVAIPSDTSQVYAVEKVWYHPGVRRYFKNNDTLSVRSMDPEDGDIDTNSPDLAILQLAASGPELTVEFTLATPLELAELFAQPAAIMGFPSHDTKGWPALEDTAAATYHDGVISRLTDFQGNPSVPVAERQFVQYTMATWPGFSGSPVFLPGGRVAAVHNSAPPVEGRYKGQVITIPHGIRIDCVTEMLVHHGLDDKVSFKIDKTKVALDRWTKPDARSEKSRADFAKAEQLVGEAWGLINKQKFQAAIEKCKQAIELAPRYAPAFRARSLGNNNYFASVQTEATTADKLKYLRLALADAQMYEKIASSDPEGSILGCSILINLGIVKDDDADVRNALQTLSNLLTSENLPILLRAQAHSYRGKAYSFRLIGEPKAALTEYNESLRLYPSDPGLWENRAGYWQYKGRDDLAAADRAKAKELRRLRRNALKISTVLEGGAALKAGLRPGDIIYGVGTTRVHNLEELTAALAKATGAIEIAFISSQNGKDVGISITPVAGKIGVTVDQVELD